MIRKQAKRKSRSVKPKFRLPRFHFARLVTILGAFAVVVLTYRFSASMLDRPIQSKIGRAHV